MKNLELFKKEFDPYLRNFLDQKIRGIKNYTKSLFIYNYLNYTKTIFLKGGKRIRPYVAYLMYESLEGRDKKNALKLLISLELFHAFCLVHDDIIDKGTLRHNMQTLHIYIADKIKKRQKDYSHIGNSQAMLVGDLLFAWSQEIINSNTDFNQKIMKNIKHNFYEMVTEVVLGQMLDVDITTHSKLSLKTTDEKNRLKTASYTFIRPLKIGACLAGKLTKEVKQFCEEFGLALGIAFQTQDDIFDEADSAIQSGKRIIERNIKTAKQLLDKLSITDSEKGKFFALIEIIQNRTF